jgi:hypothetical protein
MYDPQTIQLIVMAVSLGFSVTFIVALFYGLFLLAKIRKQAVGINERLDELLSRITAGPGNAGGSGMSL